MSATAPGCGLGERSQVVVVGNSIAKVIAHQSGCLPLLLQVLPDFPESTAPHRVLLSRLLDSAAEHLEGIGLRLLVDLQEAEGFAKAMSDEIAIGGGLTFFDALGNHLDRVDLGHV